MCNGSLGEITFVRSPNHVNWIQEKQMTRGSKAISLQTILDIVKINTKKSFKYPRQH